MGLIVAIFTAVILGLIILKKPFIGLIVVIVSEYTRIGTLFPDFGVIHFPALMIGVTLFRFMVGLLFSKDIKIPYYPQNIAQIGFFCVMGINVIFARLNMPAFKIFYGHIGILIYFFMMISLLNTCDKLKQFVFFFILANAFLALMGLHNYFIEGKNIDNLATGGFVGGADGCCPFL